MSAGGLYPEADCRTWVKRRPVYIEVAAGAGASDEYHPSMAWVIQQLREATPFGRQPRYVFRDNDGIFGHEVRAFFDSCGIEEVRTAYRSP